jgi:hypothetical protein
MSAELALHITKVARQAAMHIHDSGGQIYCLLPTSWRLLCVFVMWQANLASIIRVMKVHSLLLSAFIVGKLY